MPEWMKNMEKSMRSGGVDEPYALMNAMGIKRGSKTVVSGASEAKEKAGAYARHIAAARRMHSIKRRIAR